MVQQNCFHKLFFIAIDLMVPVVSHGFEGSCLFFILHRYGKSGFKKTQSYLKKYQHISMVSIIQISQKLISQWTIFCFKQNLTSTKRKINKKKWQASPEQ